jgi:hypothetical protein
MTTAKLANIAEEHTGTITAEDDNSRIRVEFPHRLRAGAFYDDMTSRYIEVVEYDPDRRFVVVQL